MLVLAKVKRLSESVTVPKPLLKEPQRHLEGIEEIMATLKEIMNREGLERIQKAVKEHKKGEYTVAETPEDIEKSLTKN